MQINFTLLETVVIFVALILILGTERLVTFGHELQKAWRDLRAVFRRTPTK